MPRLLTDEASNTRREVRHLGQEVARLALSGPDEWGGVLRRLRPTDIQTATLYTKPTQSDLDKVIDELDKNDGNSMGGPNGIRDLCCSNRARSRRAEETQAAGGRAVPCSAADENGDLGMGKGLTAQN